jgi:cyclopropane fatty-acyl-phospholipid synthase-like methyltransferase
MMGPNPLWLMEHLTDRLALEPGQRVMDLGCGRALSSVFLAREFDVRVHAVDLWIPAAENWSRIQAAGMADRIVPIRAEAHQLPFADGYFDAILSVDAYHYFGTDPGYLGEILRFLPSGGRLGVVAPGVSREIERVPDWLAPFWEEGFSTFHGPGWWRALWEGPGLASVECAEWLPHGHEDWLRWAETWDTWARSPAGTPFEREAAMLRADAEGLLGFVALVAAKR